MTQTIFEASSEVPELLLPVMRALCSAAAQISEMIARGGAGSFGASVGNNSDGDDQKALDVIADEAFVAALRGTGVRWYASEEKAEAEALDATGLWALAIDPLDGSSNIDVNVSIGTIFGIGMAEETAQASFLRAGHALKAAGYFIYGPQTQLVVSFGAGVLVYHYDRVSCQFRAADGFAPLPAEKREFAINASNMRHWQPPVRSYIEACLAGEEGPRGANFNMRWVGSLIAETHRILTRGGVFLYPSDARKGYENGRLRLVYECAPIAFLVEQAGGAASNGLRPVLDLVPDQLHARAPLIFGPVDEVARIVAAHEAQATAE